MNREDIIRMAREARLAEHTHPYELWSASDDGLERFAKLVAAAERYTICALLNRLADTYEDLDRQGSAEDIRKLIRHIRARGNDAA